MPAPLSLVLVNDYEVVVQGLVAMLRPFEDRVRVTDVVPGGVPRQDSDIALYDSFGSRQGDLGDRATALRNFRAERLVVYTWNVDAAFADPALKVAASAFVSKDVGAEELVRTLEQVHAGVAPRVVTAVRPTQVGGRWPGQGDGLTERESETLALVTQGLSTADIAARAHVSVNTVRAYLRSIYAKTGVSTRPQAVLWGIDHGFRNDRGLTSERH